MVEIREETDDTVTDPPNGDAAPRRAPPAGGGNAYLQSRPTDSVLWILRLLTVVFALLYTFPLAGAQSQASFYARTLMAGAATNALRLHQRLGGFQFSREFLTQMFMEDACHYFFYCVLFLGSQATTMVLLPILLFAVLHSNNYSVQVLDAMGKHDSIVRTKLKSFTEVYATSLLNVIACTEIFLMPMVVVMVFMGRASLFIPFIYYRFVTLRYMSRRNPNTRYAFYQLRVALEQACARPQCPPAVRNGAHRLVEFIGRLAPAVHAA